DADEELRRLHVEQLGGREVARLVQDDRQQEDHNEGDHAHDPPHHVLLLQAAGARPAILPVSSRARFRAHCSAASTSATSPTLTGTCSESTRSTVSMMAGKARAPARNAPTHSSLAALYTAGAVPPACPAALGSRIAGNASSSSGRNSQLDGDDQVQAADTPASRSGQDRPSAIGSRMSGGVAGGQ